MNRRICSVSRRATALIVLVTPPPFMPGSYHPSSVPLSAMARVFGFAGLLFVPLGALWTASPTGVFSDRQYAFAIMA